MSEHIALQEFERRSRPYADIPELAVEPKPRPTAVPQPVSAQPEEPRAKAEEPPAAIAPEDSHARNSFLSRALAQLRSLAPYAQKVLPLLEGNWAGSIAGLIATPPQAPVKVETEALERSVSDMSRSAGEIALAHRELRTQMQEQSVQIKRVEEQLERVREATDRNTLEQQELIEDLKTTAGTLRTVAIVAITLLVLSLGFEGYTLNLLLHLHK